jgi:hypothetical protein
VTAIQESACKVTEWHIARLPKTSAKACFAQQAITKKKYKTKIMVKSRPDVPNVWPMKIGTNLSRKEILDLEHTSF